MVLALHVFVFVSLEHLALGGLVLLILILKVAELSIKLVEGVLEVLHLLHGLTDLALAAVDGLLLRVQEVRYTGYSLFVVVDLDTQDVDSLVLGLQVLVQVEANVPQASQLLVVFAADLFLIIQELLGVVNFFAEIQVGTVLIAAFHPESCQLSVGRHDIPFGNGNLLEDMELLLLCLHVVHSDLIEFPDQHVNFVSVLRDLVETIGLELLFLELHVLVLLLKVPKLVLKGSIVALAAAELVDFLCQF